MIGPYRQATGQEIETMKRQVVLDTETTGLDPNGGHRLVEVAGVELVDGKRTGQTGQYFINPQRKIPREATDIHGITDAQVKDKPPFGEIARQLLDFLDGAELVIHNAPFDVGFLDAEFKRAGFKAGVIGKHCTVLDTLKMARDTWPGKSNKLDAVLDRLKIDRSHRTLHGALLDAELLTDAYEVMTILPRPNTVGCILREPVQAPGNRKWTPWGWFWVLLVVGLLGFVVLAEADHNQVVDGQKTGHWTENEGYGTVWQGPYVNGKKHGHWVITSPHGRIQKGPMVDGKQHGEWTITSQIGDDTVVQKGPYVDGQRHGHWVETYDGPVWEGPYVDGKKHGHWTRTGPDGRITEGPYVDGQQTGEWTTTLPDGMVAKGPMVDDERHGHWVFTFASGQVSEGPYVNGQQTGEWTITFSDGEVSEGPMVDGERQGHWTITHSDGTVSEGPYVDGKKHGHWVQAYPDGGVMDGQFVNDKQHGQWMITHPDGTVDKIRFAYGHRVGG